MNDPTPVIPWTLADYERRKLQVQQDIKDAKDQFAKVIASLEYEWRAADTQARFIIDNLDSATILHAEHVIYVSGRYENAGSERAQAREDAIQQLLKGGGTLKQDYIATKDYDRWHGQHVACEYSCVPQHGSVIFAIGLVKAERGKAEPLDDTEISAAVYYLRNLERIQAAQQESANTRIAA